MKKGVGHGRRFFLDELVSACFLKGRAVVQTQQECRSAAISLVSGFWPHVRKQNHISNAWAIGKQHN